MASLRPGKGALALALCLAGCTPGSDDGPADSGATPAEGRHDGAAVAYDDAGPADSGMHDAARADTDAGDDAGVEPCPEPEGDGTAHEPFVSEDTTWTLEGSPHTLPNGLSIERGVELRIEACAVVRVAADKSIAVGGALTVAGEPGRPVRFERLDPDRPWGAITSILGEGPVTLVHATLTGGGAVGNGVPEQTGVLRFEARSGEPLSELLAVDAVTILDSATNGVNLSNNAAFTGDSRGLVIEGSADFPVVAHGWPASTLPEGRYEGNGQDAILVRTAERIGIDGLVVHARWRDRGVPYRIGGATDSEPKRLRVGAPMGLTDAELVLDPGVQLQFSPTAGLTVYGKQATLYAVGLPGEPVVFTSASEPASAGDWLGIQFEAEAGADSRIEYAQILYAGNPNTLTSGYSCGAPPAPPTEQMRTMGAVYFSLQRGVPSSFIRNTEIRHSASNGIDRGWTGESVDMLETNTFSDIAYCKQTDPLPEMGSCDDPPACPPSD